MLNLSYKILFINLAFIIFNLYFSIVKAEADIPCCAGTSVRGTKYIALQKAIKGNAGVRHTGCNNVGCNNCISSAGGHKYSFTYDDGDSKGNKQQTFLCLGGKCGVYAPLMPMRGERESDVGGNIYYYDKNEDSENTR